MREVDRIMVEELQVDLLLMMENAGRSLAELAVFKFRPSVATVLAGPGGNGGGGLAAARHLANRGVDVHVVLDRPVDRMAPIPAHQLLILQRMGVRVMDRPPEADLLLDCLLGYSLQGNPRGRTAELVQRANAQSGPVLALDTPSGLDVTTGEARTPCVRATATLTLALPKVGLLTAAEVGELYLADISVPASAYARLGLSVPRDLFAQAPIVEIDLQPR